MSSRTPSPLDRPAQYLKGVGPKRAELLARLDIQTARDLLYHVPRRYEDASTVSKIKSLEAGMDATVIGEVFSKHVHLTRPGLRIFQVVLQDDTGAIECAWPGQPYLDRVIERGDLLLVSGRVRFFRGRQLQPREWINLGTAEEAGAEGKVLPIYPATEGLSQRMLRRIVDDNVDALLAAVEGEEPFGREQLKAAGVIPLRPALEALHKPQTLADAERGRRRLAYEELFFLQLLHARAHYRATRERQGIAFRRTDELIGRLYRALPFTLTEAQTRALREIVADMTSAHRMNRLLQGDVGSGKTVVALFAMLLANESGFQTALMAPTEILAEQHLRTLRLLLAGLPVRVVLLTGRLGAAERREALAGIASGEAGIIVGTHALIQESVSFHKLGLAVVDEQHRFGVRQRMALAEMGDGVNNPDLLVMSATPIPRSLALSLYGDLDFSILDERPPGRQPIRTALRPQRARARVFDFIREQVTTGRQAYVVYPLVEESEKVDLRAASEEYERLRTEVFPDLRVGLVHGQMPGEEKDATMRAFAGGELDVLVATSVIEVGIDVPNATVMVVEHAERFGLAQLHQLRGRIGRGAAESWCILLTDTDPQTAERLQTLVRTDDGFEIARTDLRLRGMGDFFGARQHGLPAFRFFDPGKDEDLLGRARDHARALVADDPELDRHPAFREILERRWQLSERMYETG